MFAFPIRTGNSPIIRPLGNMKDVTNELCKELQKRAKFGERKYKTRLHPFNGRSALRDAFEEACDLSCYLKQLLMEEEMEGKIKRIRKKAPQKIPDFEFKP